VDRRDAGRLVAGDGAAGQPSAQPGVEPLDRLRERARVGGVGREPGQPGEVEQAAPVVHHHHGDLLGPVAGGQPTPEQAQQARLAALGSPRTRKCGGRYQFQ
jgi:hypothetical protein